MSKMTQSIATVKREVRMEEWKRQVAACTGSGLSVRQWCVQEGIAPGTYYNRLRKVRECALENEIVSVSLQNPTCSSDKIEITTEQMKISLPSVVSEATLALVLKTLQSC